MHRFLREAAADDKIEKSALLTWPYGDALLHVSVMNEQAAAKPAHIELKFGETVQRASAMALDAPQTGTRSMSFEQVHVIGEELTAQTASASFSSRMRLKSSSAETQKRIGVYR